MWNNEVISVAETLFVHHQLHAVADDLGVRATVVTKAAATMSDQIQQALPEVAKQCNNAGDHPRAF